MSKRCLDLGVSDEPSYFLRHDPRLGRPPLRTLLNFTPPTTPDKGVKDAVEVQTIVQLKKRVKRWKALTAILLSWLIYGRKPLRKGQADPLKRWLGPIFTGMERKWWVDELYWAVFVNRYVDISRFVANVIDGRFWHDWFHEKVLAGTYNWVSTIALNRYADQRGIDAFANGLGTATKRLSERACGIQSGFVRSYALSVLLGVVLMAENSQVIDILLKCRSDLKLPSYCMVFPR